MGSFDSDAPRQSSASVPRILADDAAKSAPSPPRLPLTVHLAVHIHAIRPEERVYAVGNCAPLGDWRPDAALELTRDPKMESTWRASIRLEGGRTRAMLRFRYFVGAHLQAGADPATRTLVVRRWEAQRCTRVLMPSVESRAGECRAAHTDEFGTYGGRAVVSDGWLRHKNETEILLRFHGDCFKFYKSRHSRRRYHVKVTAFDLRHREMGSLDDEPDDVDSFTAPPPLPSFTETELAILSRDDPYFAPQRVNGEPFEPNKDFFVFRTISVAVEYLAFRVEFFAEHHARLPTTPSTTPTPTTTGVGRKDSASDTNSEEHSPEPRPTSTSSTNSTSTNSTSTPRLERVGVAYCMPASMPDTAGKLQIPVLARNQMPIGQVTVDYLFIKSLDRPLKTPLTMEHSYARHWKKRRTVEVGHRGFGNSYTKLSAVRENTIHSLRHASDMGADFVEFDVQLTKDKVPVVFHDFHVLVHVAKRSAAGRAEPDAARSLGSTTGPQHPAQPRAAATAAAADYHEMAVKDLKLQQLQLLHVEHYQAPLNANMLRVTGAPDECADRQPFPTLVEALQRVPADTGFNVEIKYPMGMEDGEHECPNYFERNDFVDRILQDVLDHAGRRRIVFSSFEPDICAMVSRKQPLLPVLFLCVGATQRYTPFADRRSACSRTAVSFAACRRLLGLNFHSEELLRDRRPAERARRHGLVSFVWGDDLDQPAHIDYFRKELCVEGIIYDKIGEVETRRNVFVVEREQRNALFRVSPTPSRHPSLEQPTLNGRASPRACDALNLAVCGRPQSSGSSSSADSTPP